MLYDTTKQGPFGRVLWRGAQLLAVVLVAGGVIMAYRGLTAQSLPLTLVGFAVMGPSVGFLTAPLTEKSRANRRPKP